MALASMSLLAAACGSDDESSDAADTTAAETADTTATEGAETTAAPETTEAAAETTAGGADTTEAAAGEEFTLDGPINLVGLISDPGGTDQNAVPDFNNGIRLAVDEINAAGGIGGQELTYEAIETLATGDSVINSLNLALEKSPTVLLGPASSTALLAITERVDQAGVPMIHTTTEPKAVHDGEAGSQWIFSNRPSNAGAAALAVQYAVEELGATELGLMHVNTSFGEGGAAAQKEAATAAGATIAAEQAFEFNATDLVNAALAMDGVDAILDWGTPGTVGLAVNTLAQQGLGDIPHIGPGSVGFGFFTSIVGDPALLEGMYGVVDCNPAGDDRPIAQDFVTAYTEAYGSAPSYAAAEQYDTVYMIAEAITNTQSLDPDVIRQGIEELAGFEGVCATYTQDNGLLNNSSVVAKFEDGALVTQKAYEIG